MKNQFQSFCLLAIVVLLSILIFRPHEKIVSADVQHEYVVVNVGMATDKASLEQIMHFKANAGYRFIGSVPSSNGQMLVFEK
jgi:hypothetical protein